MRTSWDNFSELAKRGGIIPVYQKVLSDLLTPVGAFLRIQQNTDFSFLLESVEKGRNARYSYLGRKPSRVFRSFGSVTQVFQNDEWSDCSQPILEIIEEINNSSRKPELDGLPDFCGGMVGFLGYETVPLWEPKVPTHKGDTLPDAVMMEFDELLVFDHVAQQVIVIANVNLGERDYTESQLQELYNKAHERIDTIGYELHRELEHQLPARQDRSSLKSNFKKEEFEEIVTQAKEKIVEGEIFQIVLSQCFFRDTGVEATTLYRALRTINPSPYMFLLDCGDFQIIGASPELLVKVNDSRMEVRPIAGTRKRGANEEQDRALEEDLLADKKECAEHLMLVDLGRNDVGRVCEYGSVKVSDYMVVERYSHVMHIVSDVEGTLRKDYSSMDALKSAFPAGTTSGAPKIRAMQLINQFEKDRRNVYSGAIGFFDYYSNMNTCIAIRTLVKEGKRVSFQAGAGIVYDSVPHLEYEETWNKARAIMKAIDFAEDGLVARNPGESE